MGRRCKECRVPSTFFITINTLVLHVCAWILIRVAQSSLILKAKVWCTLTHLGVIASSYYETNKLELVYFDRVKTLSTMLTRPDLASESGSWSADATADAPNS